MGPALLHSELRALPTERPFLNMGLRPSYAHLWQAEEEVGRAGLLRGHMGASPFLIGELTGCRGVSPQPTGSPWAMQREAAWHVPRLLSTVALKTAGRKEGRELAPGPCSGACCLGRKLGGKTRGLRETLGQIRRRRLVIGIDRPRRAGLGNGHRLEFQLPGRERGALG